MFEGGVKPARGTVEVLLGESDTAESEEREASVRQCTGHSIRKLAQTSIALAELLLSLTILTSAVRQKSRDGQGLANQQGVTGLPRQRQTLVAEDHSVGIVALVAGQHPRRHEGLHAACGGGVA
jgi:hypothetical protein